MRILGEDLVPSGPAVAGGVVRRIARIGWRRFFSGAMINAACVCPGSGWNLLCRHLPGDPDVLREPGHPASMWASRPIPASRAAGVVWVYLGPKESSRRSGVSVHAGSAGQHLLGLRLQRPNLSQGMEGESTARTSVWLHKDFDAILLAGRPPILAAAPAARGGGWALITQPMAPRC